MLSLYVHTPFCVKKCLYCAFYSTTYTIENAQSFIAALHLEATGAARTFSEKKFSSVYFGGGTPTILSPGQFTSVISIVRSHFTIMPDAEITVEANPHSGSDHLFRVLRKCGVNRLSIGVQSFSDRLLEALGRPHHAAQAHDAFRSARRCGFKNIGIDLIYGIPGQTLADWTQTLDSALALRPDHVSAYSLSLDAGSAYHQKSALGLFQMPDDDSIAELYDAGVKQLTASGFTHYEISNFARPGFECRHNLNYWSRGEYLGLGPGAWSFIYERRSRSVPDLVSYCNRLHAGSPVVIEEEVVSQAEAALETVMLRLRTRRGIELESFAREFGPLLRDRLSTQAGPMIDQGLLQKEGTRLFLTDLGMALSNEVIARLSR